MVEGTAKGAKAVGKGVETGAKAVAKGAETGAKAVAKGAEKVGQTVADGAKTSVRSAFEAGLDGAKFAGYKKGGNWHGIFIRGNGNIL